MPPIALGIIMCNVKEIACAIRMIQLQADMSNTSATRDDKWNQWDHVDVDESRFTFDTDDRTTS